MAGSPALVVIDIIDILRVLIEAKNHPPVGPDGHGPETPPLAFERMQTESRKVHVGDRWSGMKRRQNIPQLVGMIRIYAAWVVLLKEPLQTLVADRSYPLVL
jgi:hypothetical protein